MSQAVDIDVRQLVLSNGTFGPREIEQITKAVSDDMRNYRILRDAVAELASQGDLSPAGYVRLGVCQYLLGRYQPAIESLQKGDGGALARFYLARASFAQEQYSAANQYYQQAAQAGYDADLCALGRAETYRYMGNPQESLKVLDNLSGPVEETAEYLAQRAATIAAIGGNPQEVVALYERAVQADPQHPGALFGLALENDRYGNDEEALRLYERAALRFPSHIGALLNLGILYEDQGQFDRAAQCYGRILRERPDHPRARLYFRDTQASTEMYYDEDEKRKRDRLSQVLGIPVTDFELSVRSRNCLQKMGIRTLGDLTATTEQELLASKNFGETSLVEIKEMLQSKGLQLGQFAKEKHRVDVGIDLSTMTPDEQALLNKPIAELQLSVRARKCMARLGISTIGELIRHTGDELLECKNFGVTSLNEVREKLSVHGLRLRGE